MMARNLSEGYYKRHAEYMRKDRLLKRIELAKDEIIQILARFGHKWFNVREYAGQGQKLFRLFQLGLLERSPRCNESSAYRVPV